MKTNTLSCAMLMIAYPDNSLSASLYAARDADGQAERQASLNEALERACALTAAVARAQGECADEANKEWAMQRIAHIFDEIEGASSGH